jgi:hypothetical protein
MLPPEPDLPDDLAAAWDAVQADWSAEPRHAAFIELCVAAGRLPDAGTLYRRCKELQPERAAVAERQLQRIMGRALAMLADRPPSRAAPNARWVVLLFGVLIAALMMGSAIWAAARLLARGAG